MEHIFGVLGNHPGSDLINYAAKLIDDSDDKILSRITHENIEIITFGNGIEKTFKINKKHMVFSIPCSRRTCAKCCLPIDGWCSCYCSGYDTYRRMANSSNGPHR